ncbi:battenin isoform X2 [Anas platyrhynchos]|uniref:battenin isoform X2 n=1 Tax=Anas platyrhynchos TaxID=8839 RepID=UPI003AF221CD
MAEPAQPGDGDEDPPEPPQAESWRNGAAFWLLGLCNNTPYVVMLSAAHDMLRPPEMPPTPRNGSRYDCNPTSTGAVLLADILPTLLIKLAAPFCIHLVPYNLRVIAVTAAAWGSFALVAAAAGVAVSLGGVVLASASSGLGEVTFLALSSLYPSSALSWWSSGTGAAGLGGALAYLALTQAGLSPPRALLPLLLLPPVTLLSYFCLLRPPGDPPPDQEPLLGPGPDVGLGLAQKWKVLKRISRHMVPLGFVYFAEYFSNQGLLELLYFPESSLTHSEQYRWYQLLYQGAVFASRSSLRCCRFRPIWVLALLQGLVAGTLFVAVAAPFLPGVGAAFALVLLEGLLGARPTGTPSRTCGTSPPPRSGSWRRPRGRAGTRPGSRWRRGRGWGCTGRCAPPPDHAP